MTVTRESVRGQACRKHSSPTCADLSRLVCEKADRYKADVKRVMIFAACFALAAMLFAPRIVNGWSSGRRVETSRAYSLFLSVERNTELDLKQLLLNVAVAALIGGMVGRIPPPLFPQLVRGALVCVLIAFLCLATALLIGLVVAPLVKDRTARLAAPDRARADEKDAAFLSGTGAHDAATMRMRTAAELWRTAGRHDEARRVEEKAISYAREAPVMRARAQEAEAQQLLAGGSLAGAKTMLSSAADNWREAQRPDEEARVRATIPNLRLSADAFLDAPEEVVSKAMMWEKRNAALPAASPALTFDNLIPRAQPTVTTKPFDPDEFLKSGTPARATPKRR